ncbi:glycosyltransferase family 2 protein [Halomonas urumqiensis]|nr:glycosyltransferase family 2 protein [Halomonas urumqiensis]GHE20551.1 hypothetical protein GCM10017767_10720 [Halomonas urumqiensis]
MVELDIEGDILHGVASFVLETRRRRIRVDMPLRSSKTAKRMLHVPLGVRRITMQVFNAHGGFNITRFRWIWLSPMFARGRLANRLSNIHPSYQGLSEKQVIRALHLESVARCRSWRHVAYSELERTIARDCARHDYHQWVALVEPVRKETPGNAPQSPRMLMERPLISVLMPFGPELMHFGPETAHSLVNDPHGADEEIDKALEPLRESLLSMLNQHYAHWELCVVLSPGVDPVMAAKVRQCLGTDARVRVSNGAVESLGRLSHQAFIESNGEGVMWLSPGDCLAEDALQRVVEAWNRQPAAQLFYADEDELNERGERVRPRFKPGWNPDLLLSCNYVGRLALYKRRILWRLEVYRDIGRFDHHHLNANELDHAMALRFLAWWYQLTSERRAATVCHLPWVLYHRGERAHVAGSAAEATGETDVQGLAHTVGQVQALLALLPGGEGAVAEPGMLPESVRVKWPLPVPPPLVSLLVPTRDGVDILRPCVDAILERTEYRHFELLILDNQSTCAETLAYMAEVEQRDPRVRVLRWDHPFNYSAINNFGAEHAKGEIIGLVNNDVEPMEGEWLTEMVSQACRPEIGCVGAKLYYPNDTIQHGGVILGLGGVAGHAHRFFPRHEDGNAGRLKLVQNLSAVTAACLLLRKEVFDAVGGLNEADLSVAYNDVDLCLKVREAGYRNLWTPYAELYHHESISRGAEDTPEKRARWLREIAYMKRTWGKKLRNDPAYNPNLTLVYEDFSFR